MRSDGNNDTAESLIADNVGVGNAAFLVSKADLIFAGIAWLVVAVTTPEANSTICRARMILIIQEVSALLADHLSTARAPSVF